MKETTQNIEIVNLIEALQKLTGTLYLNKADKLSPRQVPGYTGHVPAVKAENLFAKSFTRIVDRANKLGTKRKFNISERDRLKSQSSIEFNKYNFTRLIKEPELLENKDYNDYAYYVNKELNVSQEAAVKSKAFENEDLLAQQNSNRNPYNSIAIRNLLKNNKNRVIQTLKTRRDFFSERNLNSGGFNGSYGQEFNRLNSSPIKPKLIETKIAKKETFLNMSNGFQKIFTKDGTDQEIKIPIAGYQVS